MANPTLLLILDGFGYRQQTTHNAIAQANTPHWDQLWHNYPHHLIAGSGTHVGLPEGQMGNSEVGHLNLGAGRVIYQEFTRIQQSISDGDFFKNETLVNAVRSTASQQRAIHIFGLLSSGGVHSHEQQIHAMVRLACAEGAKQVYVHAFLDGRDTPPQSAQASIDAIQHQFQRLGCGAIASLVGRYYAMDRDKRWQRVKFAYDLLSQGQSEFHFADAIQGLLAAYDRNETDEFVRPTAIHPRGQPPVIINDGDSIIFMNYRADRARQLTQSFIDADFSGFQRSHCPILNKFVSLTQYATELKTSIAYPLQTLKNTLGEHVANLGLRQLRIAETEKYAHVTFFFNGGIESPFPGEDRILVPSPKVATYDLQPQMSAFEVTKKLVAAITSKQYPLIICNFANADMVGHTGNFVAAKKAIETLDQCIGDIVTALNQVNGEMLVTADHGNAEIMFDEDLQQPHTAHTHQPVPLVYMGRNARFCAENGNLADIAPTMLSLMKLPIPTEMTGTILLKVDDSA